MRVPGLLVTLTSGWSPDQFTGDGRKLIVLALRPTGLDDEDPHARNLARRGLRAGDMRYVHENQGDGEQLEAH
jgi:hypothetical protein